MELSKGEASGSEPAGRSDTGSSMEVDSEEQSAPSFMAPDKYQNGNSVGSGGWQMHTNVPHPRRSASPASSSSASGSLVGGVLDIAGGSTTIISGRGYTGSVPNFIDGNGATQGGSEKTAKPSQFFQQQQQAVASGETEGGVISGRRVDHCPVCKLSFGRLKQHLQRNPVCGGNSLGQETLRRLLALPPKRGGSSNRKGMVVAATDAAAVAAGVSTGEAAAESEEGGGDGSQRELQRLPCPICGKFYLRVGHHLRRGDCKKAYEGQQWRAGKTPTTVKCVFCDENIEASWEAIKAHSDVCVPGIAAAAASVVAVAMAAQEQQQQQKELHQQFQQQQQQPWRRRQGTTTETNNGAGRSGRSGSVSGSGCGSSDGAVSGSHEGGSTTSNNQNGASGGSAAGRGGRASPSPPNGQVQQEALTGLPPKLKRRSSGASSLNSSTNAFGRRGSAASSSSSLFMDRQRSAESFSSYSGRALGSDSDSSDSESEGMFAGGMGGGGMGGGGMNGGGTVGGGICGSILGATRRPMPPKKRWETEFEAWAKGEGYGGDKSGEDAVNGDVDGSGVGATVIRQGGIAKDSSIGVEERYPCLMDRAGDSALVTVREVRRVERGGDVDKGGEAMATSERREKCEAVVECSMVIARGKVDKNRSSGDATAAVASAVSVIFGVEISEPSGSDGKEPPSEYPRVSSVAAGSPADRAGIARGAAILEVEGTSMHLKTAADVTRAMSSVLRKRPKGGAGQARVRVVVATPPWPLPRQPSLLSTTVKSEVEERELEPPGAAVGGMACLGREHHRGREFIEMCWSVLMHPEGGIPPPTAPDCAQRATVGERPPEEEEEIVRRLGFDVERRELSEGMECIEVATLRAGGLASRHGLRVGDLILAVDGRHLLSCSGPSFWLEVGRLVRACDVTRETQQQQQKQKNQRGNTGPMALEDILVSSAGCWLRLLVVRKGSPPTSVTAPHFPATGGGVGAKSSSSSSSSSGGNNGGGGSSSSSNGSSKVKGVAGGRGGRSAVKGGGGARVSKGGRGRGARGRGRSSQPADWRSTSSRKSQEQMSSDGPPATTTAVPKASAASASASAVPGGGGGAAVVSSPPSILLHSNGTPSLPSPPPPPPLAAAAAATTTTSSSAGPKTTRASKAGEGSGRGRGGRTESSRVVESSRRRREARKRPAWWLPQEKGSYRCVLSLRPADALPGAVPGAPVPPGAFLLEDAKLGEAMTIPAGAKLISVDGKPTGDLPFDQARQVAMAGGKDTVLVFE